MEFLQRQWTQIRAHLEGLSLAEKWLIASLLAVMVLAGSWFVLWAAQPSWVPMHGFADANNQQVVSLLNTQGIDTRQEAGRLLVRRGHEDRALSILVQQDLLRADPSEAFDQLIEQQSPWRSNQQNQQAYLLATQRVLGNVMTKMRGVDNAEVVISMPEDRGFGRTHVNPSASVTIWMSGGDRVRDSMVDSAARLVAGAVAEMTPHDVQVTDGHHGRTRTVRDEDDMLPSDFREHVRDAEQALRENIEQLLSYVGSGLIVAVNAQVDPTQREDREAYTYMDEQPLQREVIERDLREQTVAGGEAGARPNTGANIAGGSADGMREENERQQTEFAAHPLTERSRVSIAGYQVRQKNVSINVPRSFFVAIHRSQNPDLEEPPTDEDLQPVVDQHLDRIRDQVEPLLQAEELGQVRVHMVPDADAPSAMVAHAGGMDAVLSSDWAQPLGIGTLALASVGLMLLMVRKATQKPDLPSIEELTGEAPQLDEVDWIEEADEGDSPLSGVEVNEESIRSRKMAEQISEMVKGNPSEAGSLIGRWVRRGN